MLQNLYSKLEVIKKYFIKTGPTWCVSWRIKKSILLYLRFFNINYWPILNDS